jgi:CheY-like chemotaxis protein
MQGRIWVESFLGQGSCFHFTVCLEASADAGQPAKTPIASVLKNPAPLRILLAEDTVVNQRLALRILEKEGYQVALAKNGREALALWRSQPFDLILMDIQMPEMDGFQATSAIRHAEATANTHISIVALTAHAMTGDRERCLAAGMDDYLSKPLRKSDLLEMVARHTRTSQKLELSTA